MYKDTYAQQLARGDNATDQSMLYTMIAEDDVRIPVGVHPSLPSKGAVFLMGLGCASRGC